MNVVNQLLKEVPLIISLQQIVMDVLWSLNMLVVFSIKLIVWWLYLLFKVKYFNYICFLTGPRWFAFMAVLLVSLSIIGFFVVTVEIAVMVTTTAYFVESARNSVFCNAVHNLRTILQLLLWVYDVLSACHQNLNSF